MTAENRSFFWRMWRIQLTRYFLLINTPWFALHVRSGFDYVDSLPWDHWLGIRLYWCHKRGWQYSDGDFMFTKFDPFLSCDRFKQRVYQ